MAAGTEYKLVERLVYHKYADSEYTRVFLATYRSFMGAGRLLEMVIERYEVPVPVNISKEEFAYTQYANWGGGGRVK